MNFLLIPAQIFAFVVLWLLSFLLHEWCHSLEMYRQTGLWGSIHMDGFGFWCNYHKDVRVVASDRLVSLAGGVYCSIFLFFLACLAGGFFSLCFLMLGWCQLVYGLMEGFGLKRYRMYWYVLLITIMVIMWLRWFVL